MRRTRHMDATRDGLARPAGPIGVPRPITAGAAIRVTRRVLAGLVALVALVVLVALVGAQPTPASAADGGAVPTFTVEVGVQGFADPDATPVLTVTVSATTALVGRIDVRSNTGAVTSRPIEVAGGTTKSVRLTTDVRAVGAILDVTLFDGDRVVSTKTVSSQPAQDVEVVGLTPRVADRLGTMPTNVDLGGSLGRAVLGRVDAEQIDLGPGALDQYDTLVASTADLAGLDAGQRRTVLIWLAESGVLVLDDTDDLSVLPAEWRPGAAGYALAGRGLVRVDVGGSGAGRWSSMVLPTPSRSAGGALDANQFFGDALSLDAHLLARSGLTVPRLAKIVLPLAGYALVAALGVYVVVRRLRRMTLAWALIPAVAVIGSGVMLGVGNGWRSNGHPASLATLDCSIGGCDQFASLLNFRRSGGTATADLPAGYQLDGSFNAFMSRPASGTTLLRTERGTLQLRNRVDAGQVSVTSVHGATAAAGLTLDAVSDGRTVHGTVTNRTTTTVRDLRVLTPGGIAGLGDLAPQASATYSIGSADVGSTNPAALWPAASPPGHPAAAMLAMLGLNRPIVAAGVARVVGWADSWTSDVFAQSSSGSLITTTANIVPSAGLPSDAVRAAFVRAPWANPATGLEDVVVRYDLPPGAVPGKPLQVRMLGVADTIDVLTPAGWAAVRRAGAGFTLPTGALNHGTVIVRIRSSSFAQSGLPSPISPPALTTVDAP